MSVRKIVVLGHPALRKKAQPIARVTIKERRLIDDMLETLEEADGLGLAANQVGVPLRVFLARHEGNNYVLVNPKIAHRSMEKEAGVEGCLSLPGLQAEVIRHKGIVVTGRNQHDKQVTVEAQDVLARVFQHEIDHLDGVLIIDKAIEGSLQWVVEEVDEHGQSVIRLIPTTPQEVNEHFLGKRREREKRRERGRERETEACLSVKPVERIVDSRTENFKKLQRWVTCCAGRFHGNTGVCGSQSGSVSEV